MGHGSNWPDFRLVTLVANQGIVAHDPLLYYPSKHALHSITCCFQKRLWLCL